MIWEQDEVTGNCPNTDRTSGILARGQAWMRREEPGPGTVDRWHGKANRSSTPFLPSPYNVDTFVFLLPFKQ